MSNKRFVLIATLLLGVIGCAFVFKNFKIERKTSSDIIFATSTRGNVTRAEVERYIANLSKNLGQNITLEGMEDKTKNALAAEILNNRIIVERARAAGMENSKEYKDKLSSMKDDALRTMFIDDLLGKNITSEVIKNKYEEYVNSVNGKKEFEISYIFVKEEKDINRVMKELESHTFAEVAMKYSQDPISRNNGGRIGWLLETSFNEVFGGVVETLQNNKISKPLKTEGGWYVLLKTGEREAVAPDFESAKTAMKGAATRDYLRNYAKTNTESLEIRVVE
jgi:peptidyl-prolyl cis-trans isomerase C